MLGVVISLAGVLAGAWWAPFAVGAVLGIVSPTARIAIPVGALTGLLAWSQPLGAAQLHLGLGPSADSLAAIMGFTHEAVVPVVLTCLVGLLLGLAGAWMGSAVRGFVFSGQVVSSR